MADRINPDKKLLGTPDFGYEKNVNIQFPLDEAERVEVGGNDRRASVSSRSDGRIYYNARDKLLTFNFTFEALNVAVGENFAYWQNISPTHDLVFSHIGLNAELAGQGIHLTEVTGTPGASPATIEPKAPNLNRSTSSQFALCHVMADGTGISGLTETGIAIDYVAIEGVYGHEEMRLLDTV